MYIHYGGLHAVNLHTLWSRCSLQTSVSLLPFVSLGSISTISSWYSISTIPPSGSLNSVYIGCGDRVATGSIKLCRLHTPLLPQKSTSCGKNSASSIKNKYLLLCKHKYRLSSLHSMVFTCKASNTIQEYRAKHCSINFWITVTVTARPSEAGRRWGGPGRLTFP